jgi:hypothetical protein
MAFGTFGNKNGVSENEKGARRERQGIIRVFYTSSTITPTATAQYSRAETEAVSGTGDNRPFSADAAVYQSKHSTPRSCPAKSRITFPLPSGLFIAVVQSSASCGEQVKDLVCAGNSTQTRKVCTSQQTNMTFSKVVHRRGTCGKSFGPDHAYIGSLLTSGWSPVVCIGLPIDVHDSLICGSDSCGCPVGKDKIWSNFIKTRCR